MAVTAIGGTLPVEIEEIIVGLIRCKGEPRSEALEREVLDIMQWARDEIQYKEATEDGWLTLRGMITRG